MLEIKVTIEAPGIPEAINNLAAAFRGQALTVPVIPAAPVVNTVSATQPVNATPTAAPVNVPPIALAAPTVPAAPEVTATTTAPVSQPVTVPVILAAPIQEKKITAEDISRAGAALVDQGKMMDVINLLKKYDAQAITQLKPETYNSFATDLRALGATI